MGGGRVIYEIPGMPKKTFWHNTRFRVLKIEPSEFNEYSIYTAKVVAGNGISKSGEEVKFHYPVPHDFIKVKGNILNV